MQSDKENLGKSAFVNMDRSWQSLITADSYDYVLSTQVSALIPIKVCANQLEKITPKSNTLT